MMCKCSKCGVEQERIPVQGSFRSKHIASDGKVWNGRVCPTCKYKEGRKAVKKLLKHKSPIRHCRVCAKKLPPNFYFEHPECKPDLWSIGVDEDFYPVHL